MELEKILALGNEGAPAEWLACLTGEGIGNGHEGINDDVLEKLMNEDDSNDPLLPHLPIEATPEIQFYQCNANNYTKGRGGNSISHILVHYTYGKVTKEGAALANCKYFGRGSVGASAHFFIDDGYTIGQSVSESDTAWHAGNWSMNQRSIGIEVCTAGAFTEKEIERLTWLVQRLMKKYNIPASRVIRHYDVTGKKCPAYYVDSARWKILHARITGGKVEVASPAKPNTTNTAKKPATGKINVEHQAYARGKGWLAKVLNWGKGTEGYSGWLSFPILGFRAKTKGDASEAGYLEYRGHALGGGWFGWRRDYNKDSAGDTFAGTLKVPLDGLQFRLVGAPAGKKVRYRVHAIGKGWLDWVINYGSGADGYAGWYGHAIDAVQIEIV